MELNSDTHKILELIEDRTHSAGSATQAAFSLAGLGIVSHLLQRGFVRFDVDRRGYCITSAGARILASLRNPPDPRAALDADIAACEARLADLRARRAALETGENSSD